MYTNRIGVGVFFFLVYVVLVSKEEKTNKQRAQAQEIYF